MNVVRDELKCSTCHKFKKRVKFLLKDGSVGKTCLECRLKNQARNKLINEGLKDYSEYKKGKAVIKNECLRCGKTFDAKSKFNRICNNCKESVNDSTFYF